MKEAEKKVVGAIPYFYKNNSYRFVIVTSRKRPSAWIFPKGRIEIELNDREVAINEAFEEAGVIGRISGNAVKVRVVKKKGTVLYKLYPLRISRVCSKWPERRIRRRRFVKSKKALKELNTQYAEALGKFLEEKSR